MKAQIDTFTVNLVSPQILQEKNDLKISYNKNEYPELYEYLTIKFMKNESIYYRDDRHACHLFLRGVSLTTTLDLPHHTENKNITIRESIYGPIAHKVPFDKRKDFVRDYAYGTIRVQKKRLRENDIRRAGT